MSTPSRPLQGTLFEQDYLIRTLGNLASAPDVALTELVAKENAQKAVTTVPVVVAFSATEDVQQTHNPDQ